MKNFKTGDLVHVPAGAYRMKMQENGQMSIPWDCNLCMRPLLGVFKKKVNDHECVVLFHDGEWVIDSRCVYLKNQGEKDDRISEHSKDWGNLVS
mgnify:FL=1